MKSIKKLLLIILFFAMFMIIFQINTYAKSYSIESMDIQATVQENGDVNIKQSITYNFDGDYNGIYISIPYSIEDIEHDEIISKKKINDNLYTGKGITINSITDDNKQKYIESSYGRNGKSGIYTLEKNYGIEKVKVYSPSSYETKKFILDYTIKDLCVKHKDVGELYYNFIGGEWDVDIKNLNIDVYLPNNKDEIFIWAHGPLNGVSKIISNKHANFKVDNVRKGQYVATRVVFNNSNIIKSTKISNINAKDIIFQDENEIAENKQEKEKFTQKIIIFSSILVIYWIILLIIFEKEKKFEVREINEEELFKKYNPLIAGCIQGSREILARDIIAVVLNLIEKKNINLEIIPSASGEDEYVYSISKNEDKENEMDEIERFVYNWIFQKENIKVNLQKRLEEISKEKDSNVKFKTLNTIAKRTTNRIGANNAKVPWYLRILNIGVLIVAVIAVVKHILFNGLDVYTSNTAVFSFLFMNILYFLPILFYLAYIPIRILIFIRHRVNNTIQKFTGQKVVTTSISIILIILAIIVLTLIFSPAKYLIADEMLIGIAILIVLTDNLMLKNNDEVLEDYSRLNLLKDKLDDYSLLDEKDIAHLELWDKYLCYAVSFGIGEKIIKRLKGLYIDDDLMKLVESSKMCKCQVKNVLFFQFQKCTKIPVLNIYLEGKIHSKILEKIFFSIILF